VPSWRSDVYREADLIEEVARVYGYNKIPTRQKIEIEVVPVDARQKLVKTIGRYLNGCGFYETINVTFVDDSVAGLFTVTDSDRQLAVKDVSRKNANLLRQNLIGSLLGVVKTNLNAGNSPCRIFEIADTFVPSGENDALPVEKTKLAISCDGDFRELRGVIDGLIKSLDRKADIVFRPAELVWARAGAQIVVNETVVGFAGIVSDAIREKFDFKDISLCAAELDFEELSVMQSVAVKITPIPKYPAIERDLSIVVDENISWSDVIEAVNKKSSDELEEVKFVGIYRGKGIPAGQKSVTLSLMFRDPDGTLRHEAVDRFEADIVKSLSRLVKAQLRTV